MNVFMRCDACRFEGRFFNFLFHGCSTALVGLDFLIVEVSRSPPVRHSSVGVLWTGNLPVAETSTWQHTKNSQETQTSMPPAGFGPAIPESERPQTHVLDRAATGIGKYHKILTATQRNKCRGPRPKAKWNIGERCSACRDAKRSEWRMMRVMK